MARRAGPTGPRPPGGGDGGDDGIDLAVAALVSGAVVAIPTDTVYGLAVDPRVPGATDALFAVKQRPPTLELPVLVAGIDDAEALAGPDGLSPVAARLAACFWPGALTIVVPRRAGVAWSLGGDGRTIGLRCPAHDTAIRLCQRVGALATTSANRHGSPSLTTAAAVADEFGDSVAVVVDGGVCDGPASTVVDVTGTVPRCVRHGAVAWHDIEQSVARD
jgi:L-threonylcarbamoyladenylate synthase